MSLPEPWNSLEIVKLIVSVLSTLVFLYLGLRVNHAAKRLETAQWINQKIIEKRLSLYGEIVPLLNDLYCFYVRVGRWKELTPPQIIAIKHELDRYISINAALFSTDFRRSYDEFMLLCFEMFTGDGQDAKLRTSADQRQVIVGWQDTWIPMFSPNLDCPPPYEVLAAYELVMVRFARELGL